MADKNNSPNLFTKKSNPAHVFSGTAFVSDAIHKMCSSFDWGDIAKDKKVCMIYWKDICRQKDWTFGVWESLDLQFGPYS
ncbi:hypothetical protein VIGAN_01515400 [Vigna angularis var. angularis]|uniref:Uncharacterized protein n=1 Tax=Vigna angularis var. angularis TaxID=157739 RepID=A0A0S3R9D0_PHAAN|nr:hypothetical protein VIGAN_01515400 [Vigna angularis var. angularis]